MKRELKAGMNIKFVGGLSGPNAPAAFFAYDEFPMKAKIISTMGDGSGLFVEFDWGRGKLERGTIHRRQVTHVLKPRAPKETKQERDRVRVELDLHSNGKEYGNAQFFLGKGPRLSLLPGIRSCFPVTAIELRPNEVILDRSRLAEAWDKHVWAYPANDKAAAGSSMSFEDLCRELGLGEA